MKRCVDQKYGDMLYAYELGMLGDDDRQALEIHLIECEYCSERAARFSQASDTIRNETAIHALAKSLAEEDSVAVHSGRKPVTPEKSSGRSWLYSAGVAAAVIILLLVVDWDIEISTDKHAVAADNRLVVVNFVNLVDQDDAQRLGDITASLLIAGLSESSSLSVISTERLMSLTSSLGYDTGQGADLSRSLQIAREADARWLLTGEVMQAVPQLIVGSRLVDVNSGEVVAAQRVAAVNGEDVFAVIDRLVPAIKSDLPVQVIADEGPGVSVAEITTHSPEAYRYYLEGVENIARMQPDDAVVKFELALAQDTNFAMAYFYLAAYDDEELIHQAVRCSENVSRREKYHIDCSFALYSGDTTAARESLTSLIADYPEDTYAYWRMGMINYYQGGFDSAIVYLEKALRVDPRYKRAHNILAFAYDAVGDREKAIVAINRYIDLYSDEANPYDSRGDLYARHGQLEDAINSYVMALRKKPDFYYSLQKLGRLSLFRQHYDRADSCFDILAVHGNENQRFNARYYRAVSLVLQAEFGRLLPRLDSMISKNIADGILSAAASNLLMKSRVFLELNQYDSALQCAAASRDLASSVSPAEDIAFQKYFVQTLAEIGAADSARAELEVLRSRLTQNDFSLAAYWYAKGSVERAAGKFGAAVSSFEEASRLTQGFAVEFLLARAYFENGQMVQAADLFEKILEDYSVERLNWAIWSVKAHYYLARVYEDSQWMDGAIEKYKTFLSLWGSADRDLATVSDARARLNELQEGH